MKIIGIDPGINNLGWAILEQSQTKIIYHTSGVIHSKPSDHITIRLSQIYDELNSIINLNKPRLSALEEVFVNINAKTSLTLGYARGTILSCLGSHKLKTLEYAPNTIKKTIVGNGKADKEQVMKMLKLVIPNVQFNSADEADAIAISYTGLVHPY